MIPIKNTLSAFKSNSSVIRWLALLITMIGPFASNMYLPSLPLLSHHLGSSDEMMELTVTSFLLGLAISQLIYGPLSDSYGRRKLLLLGISIALLGSIGCALADTGVELILARFILGCGIGAGAALTRSVLRDTFSGLELAKAVSINGIVFSIAPIVAPIFGGYINDWFGWEANFVFVAILIAITWIIVWKLLIETNRYLDSKAIYPKNIMKNYFSVMMHPAFIVNSVSAGIVTAGTTVYSTISPFLFQETYGLTPVEYGWITALVVSGLILGRIFNTLLISIFSLPRLMNIGIYLMIISGIMLCTPSLGRHFQIPMIVTGVIIYMTATGFILPNTYAKSLEPFAKSAGVAGALYGSVSMLISFLISVMVALIPSDSPILLGSIYIFLGTGVLLFSYLENRTLDSEPLPMASQDSVSQ